MARARPAPAAPAAPVGPAPVPQLTGNVINIGAQQGAQGLNGIQITFTPGRVPRRPPAAAAAPPPQPAYIITSRVDGVDGSFTIPVDPAFNYTIAVDRWLDLDGDGIPELELDADTVARAVRVGQPQTITIVYRPTSVFQPLARNVHSISEPLKDLSAFALLTQGTNYANAPTPGAAPGIGQVVNTALRDVLGWKVNAGDPSGFLGALTKSFDVTEVEGHTEWKWTPRTYAVQTDLSGGISGAQAVIYSRGQEVLNQALPILEGLYALRVESVPADAQALKAVISNQLKELGAEMGFPGGPRQARVEQLFSILLDPPNPLPATEPAPPPGAPPTDPDAVGGQLGKLRQELGLRTQPDIINNVELSNLFNTVEEEQNVSNFRILTDYVTSLRQTWDNNKNFFGRSAATPFYGTQLVLLSRQLSVIGETVDEVRFTLDSVFIGPEERQTTEIVFPATVTLPAHPPQRPGPVPPGQKSSPLNDPTINSQPMVLEDLLTWIQTYATTEGPELLQDGGKFAATASFLPVACTLRNLVLGALTPQQGVPPGYKTPRVQNALKDLAKQLDELAFLASPLSYKIPNQT